MVQGVELAQVSLEGGGANRADGAAGGEAKPKVEYDEHTGDWASLERKFDVQLDQTRPGRSAGLSPEEAARRLTVNGPNALTPPKVMPWYMKLAAKFLDPFMILLEVAALLCFILYGTNTKDPANLVNLWIALVLVGVIFITCFMAYYQEGQSAKIMNSFQSMMADFAKVRRGGREIQVKVEELVVGDVVMMESGTRVPADLRILDTDSLKVENSSFTGEPEPVELCLDMTDDDALHSKNLAFNSAMVVEGKGVGLVVRTGDRTMIGSIASLVGETKAGKSTLEVEVISFVHFITFMALFMAVAFYLVAVLKTCVGHIGGSCDPVKTFINVFIVLMIANVPEGLPATVTSCLTVCAQRLASRNVFIKKLDSVETLGSCTVVASDKTGTMTMNKMTVSHLWVDLRTRTTDYASREIGGRYKDEGHESFLELLVTGSLCNMCKFEEHAPEVGGANSASTVTLRNFHLIEGKEGSSSQYTLSKRHGNTVNSGTLGAGGGTMVKPNIMDAGFFDPAGPSTSTPQVKVDQKVGPNLAEIARQMSTGQPGGTLGRAAGGGGGGGGTIGRQRSVITASMLLPSAPARKVVGNPSDAAVFNFCHQFKDIEDTRREFPQLYIVPFNSRLKWMKTIHRTPLSKGTKRLAILKGAPEIVLQACSHYLVKGQEVAITDDFRKKFEEVYKEIAGMGERVLGFARLYLDPEKFGPEQDDNYKQLEDQIPHEGYTFVGNISLIDPPKPGVPDAVMRCKNAGIRVMMITGDHPLTAEAIARKVNIISDYDTKEEVAASHNIKPEEVDEKDAGAAVIMCKALESYTERDWEVLLDKPEIVFARASPQDKLTIIRHLRARDEVVAVTGDGVNDSPALKNADIGVAMGIMGTEVAKSAANVILMDDDFCSIVNGIEEGRVLFDNLTKTIAYTLTHLLPELVAITINILFSIPYGMSSLMILSIDLLSEVPPAISFAWEKSESNVMERPPRNRKVDRLVRPALLSYSYLQAGLVESGACLLAYFFVYWDNGLIASDLVGFGVLGNGAVQISSGRIYSEEEQLLIVNKAMTAYYITLVLSQFVNVFVCKTRFMPALEHGLFHNALMNYGALIELGIMIFIVFVPGLDKAFFSYPHEDFKYFTIFLISGTILVVWNELRKYLIRNYSTSWFAHAFSF